MKILLIMIIVTLVFSLFVWAHLKKKPKLMTLIIDSTNKDPQKGLLWYEQRVEEFFKPLNYSKMSKENITTYIPDGLTQLNNGSVRVNRGIYEIEINGPHHMIKILMSHLEIQNLLFDSTRA